MKEFNNEKAGDAQKKFQKENGFPDFAPRDGYCWSCKKDIYSEIDHGKYKTGKSVEEASSQLITGCPHCNRTYCG